MKKNDFFTKEGRNLADSVRVVGGSYVFPKKEEKVWISQFETTKKRKDYVDFCWMKKSKRVSEKEKTISSDFSSEHLW